MRKTYNKLGIKIWLVLAILQSKNVRVSTQSNPGFVDLGLKLGKDVLFDYIDKFGFGNVTGVDLNGEANGILFDKDKIGDLELATTAFGQGVSVTPIQLSVY